MELSRNVRSQGHKFFEKRTREVDGLTQVPTTDRRGGRGASKLIVEEVLKLERSEVAVGGYEGSVA